MSRYKLYINGIEHRYLNPLEFERKKVEGFVGLRLELSSSLLFRDHAFDYLLGLEQSNDRCATQQLLIQKDCGDGYKDYFKGKFSLNDVKWDLSKCSCSFKPQPDDLLQCILDNQDLGYNIIESETFSSVAPLDFPYEFLVCRSPSILASPCNGENTTSDGWSVFYDNPSAPSGQVRIWFREVQITPCIAGQPQAPIGTGWTLYQNSCSTNKTSKYVRNPIISAPPFSAIAIGDCSGSRPIKPSSSSINFSLIESNAPSGLNIIGPSEVFESSLNTARGKYKIELPRDSSSFLWTTSGVIESGQGTNEVTIKFNSPGNHTVSVLENTLCGNNNSDSFSVDVNISGFTTPAATLTVAPNISGVSEYYNGEILVFNASWDYIGSSDSLTWSVTGGTISYGQGTSQITVQTSNSPVISTSVSLGSGSSNFTTSLAVLPTIDPVVSINQICQGSAQSLHVPNHPGATYDWEVPSNFTIQSGQGTSQITVLSSGAPSSSLIKVTQTLPIQPNLVLIGDCGPESFWYNMPQGITYDRQRLLQDIIEDHLSNICSDAEIISDLFEWNSPQPFNYVTGKQNELKYITLSQKSDVKNPLSTEPASIGKITFNEIRNLLLCCFNVLPSIEGNRIRFEHISYYENQGSTIDLTNYKELLGTNQYEYLKNSLFRNETYQWMESRDFDFTGVDLLYNDVDGEKSICVGSSEKSCQVSQVTTDLKYIQDEPSEISNSGFVMLANGFDGVDYYIHSTHGALSDQIKVNAHLSWSNLQQNYHRHDKSLCSGWLNNDYQDFLSCKKTRSQKITIQECCIEFDPIQRVKTPLTNLLSAIGEITSVKETSESNMIEINLIF